MPKQSNESFTTLFLSLLYKKFKDYFKYAIFNPKLVLVLREIGKREQGKRE
jgi:hypothetical protein